MASIRTALPKARPNRDRAGAQSALTPHWLRDQLVDRFGLSTHTSLKLAYSGGVDSEVLLHLLVGLHRETAWPISAIHVDHGLSPNAHAWVAHCRARCRALTVPLQVEHVRIATKREEGVEAGARRARYQALKAHIGTNEVLLTAQHQQDQAETLLLRLLRGAGYRGMSSMAPQMRFGGGQLVRPLLETSKPAIVDYANAQKLVWVIDEMNHDPALARGYLRERVMPALRQFWPAASAQLAHAANHAAEASAVLDELAQLDLEQCRLENGTGLSVAALNELSPGRRKNVLRYWFVWQSRLPPSSRHLAQIVHTIGQKPSTAKAILREGESEVRRYRDQIFLASAVDGPMASRWAASWNPEDPLVLPANAGTLRAFQDFGRGLSLNRVAEQALHVRFRRGGEVCQLPGRKHHHKVKKLLQDAGIPPWERDRIPFIYLGDDLAAVGQNWVCAPYAAASGEPSLRFVIEQTAK